MAYNKLNIVPFGKALIKTGDLDPIYIGLEAVLTPDQRARWLVSYWCFYHAGLACWMSEHKGQAFWKQMMVAADNKDESPIGGRWPRGTERRHFRAKLAMRSVFQLGTVFQEPEALVERLRLYRDFNMLYTYVTKELPGFGPWIAFKIGDMLERCFNSPVNFTFAEVFMYKEPAAAADMVWETYYAHHSDIRKGEDCRAYVVRKLLQQFPGAKAPPTWNRKLNIQEIETILCKWKSHVNGHYDIGKDIREVSHGLNVWSKVSETAQDMLEAMPEEVRYD